MYYLKVFKNESYRWINEKKKLHFASLYFCHQIYHSVVKNGSVLSFSAYDSKNKSVKVIIPIISERSHRVYFTRIWIITLGVIKFFFTDSKLNCDIKDNTSWRGEWNLQYAVVSFILPQNLAFKTMKTMKNNEKKKTLKRKER